MIYSTLFVFKQPLKGNYVEIILGTIMLRYSDRLEEINQGPAPSPLANGGVKSDGFMFYHSEENRLRVGSNHSILITWGVAQTGR